MSYDAFRTKVLSCLYSHGINPDLINAMLAVMDVSSTDFDFSQKSTDLILSTGLPDVAKAFLATKATEQKSENTLKVYRQRLDRFFQSVGKPLATITTTDLRIYLFNYQSEHGIKASSLNAIRATLKEFFGWCADEEIIVKSPANRLAKLQEEKSLRHSMEAIELEKLRSVCQTLRQKALVDFLYATGCRVSEVSNMLLVHVDLESRKVHVELGKGKKSRPTYINAEAQVSLSKYLASRSDDCPYLFATERKPHRQCSVRAIQLEIAKLEKLAQIQTHVTPHVFRHTTATTAIKNGMPVEQVQRLLGHSQISTTMIYAEVRQDDVQHNHEKYVS